jgi:hypothetical protein
MLMAQDIEEEIWFNAEEEVNDDSYLKFLLGAMAFPTTQKWLENPNAWVGDTGATVNMSPHSQGMENMKEANSSDAVTMGNGQSESALQIGDIPAKLCDKYGAIKNTARIREVLHMPTAQYNLAIQHHEATTRWLDIGRRQGQYLVNQRRNEN